MLTNEFKLKMKQKLEEEKKLVEAKIKKYEKPEKPMDNPSTEDIAQDATEDILEEKLLEIHKKILEKIDMALEKIAKGAYGICEKCGIGISESELEKEPWAGHCSKCEI
ncbi:MAG: TraR/DksA family transcriptional regulator [Patescibacteria group bacterium]